MESNWKGVLDLSVNEEDGILYGATSCNNSFGLWATPLKLINFSEANAPSMKNRFKNFQKADSYEQKKKQFDSEGSLFYI